MIKQINKEELQLFTFLNTAKRQLEECQDSEAIKTFLEELENGNIAYRIDNDFDTFFTYLEDIIFELPDNVSQEAIDNFQYDIELNNQYQGSFEIVYKEKYQEYCKKVELIKKNFEKLY